MRALHPRAQRIALVLALFFVSFALYVAAESGSGPFEMALLGVLATLMICAILIN